MLAVSLSQHRPNILEVTRMLGSIKLLLLSILTFNQDINFNK